MKAVLENPAKLLYNPAMLKLDSHTYFRNRGTRVVVTREWGRRPISQHRHEFWEIVLVLSGSAIHLTGRFQHRLEAGDVLVISGRRAHGYEQTKSFNIVNILIREDMFRRLTREFRNMPGYHTLFLLDAGRWNRDSYSSHLRFKADEFAQLVEWVDRLEDECRQVSEGGRFLAEAYLTLIVRLLARRYRRGQPRAPRSETSLSRVLSRLHSHLDYAWSVAEMARNAGMSERTFYRRFGATLRTTPLNYLLQARVERAAEMLSSPAQVRTITEVAQACGFEDANYFSRCFTKFAGHSPRQFRKRALK